MHGRAGPDGAPERGRVADGPPAAGVASGRSRACPGRPAPVTAMSPVVVSLPAASTTVALDTQRVPEASQWSARAGDGAPRRRRSVRHARRDAARSRRSRPGVARRHARDVVGHRPREPHRDGQRAECPPCRTEERCVGPATTGAVESMVMVSLTTGPRVPRPSRGWTRTRRSPSGPLRRTWSAEARGIQSLQRLVIDRRSGVACRRGPDPDGQRAAAAQRRVTRHDHRSRPQPLDRRVRAPWRRCHRTCGRCPGWPWGRTARTPTCVQPVGRVGASVLLQYATHNGLPPKVRSLPVTWLHMCAEV